jgi:uncharacterized repeat protein (TIGR03803 family)
MKSCPRTTEGREQQNRMRSDSSRALSLVLTAMLTSLGAVPTRGDELVFQTLHKFQFGPIQHLGGLIQGDDGNFYGTTRLGGESGHGTVYRITPDGILTTLVSFADEPPGPLIRGNDGNFYGTTGWSGGSSSIFRVTPAGTLTKLISFPQQTNPVDHHLFFQGTGGALYGITRSSSTNDLDTVFSLTLTGELATLASFAGTEGGDSMGNHLNQLIQGNDGNFYGTMTSDYLEGPAGSVFKVSRAGAVTILASFNGANGRIPSSLIQGTDGNFYGTTLQGGRNDLGPLFDDLGTIFRMTPGGDLTTLISFGVEGVNGVAPNCLIQGNDGNFYGLGVRAIDNVSSITFFRLTSGGTFSSTATSAIARAPSERTLIQAKDGNFYTISDGDSWATTHGGENVFKITPDGVLSTLANFKPAEIADPLDLVKGSDGNFYGVARRGGLFKITPSGALTRPVVPDGYAPSSLFLGRDGNLCGLVDRVVVNISTDGTITPAVPSQQPIDITDHVFQGRDGNFYGVRYYYGQSERGSVIERLAPDGVQTNMTTFRVSPPFFHSIRGLVQGLDGNLYGVTDVADGIAYSGSLFRLTPDGETTTLISFTGTNAASPQSLIAGSDGSLYGTIARFGATDVSGAVFKSTPDGIWTTLASFHGTSGPYPLELIEGSDGNLYGTAVNDGTTAATVFKLTPAGGLTILASVPLSNGGTPGNLIQGTDGRFYGIIPSLWGMAGPNTGGAIFRLVPPPLVHATRLATGSMNLTWNSFPGDEYQVEFKPALTATNWTILGPKVITATNMTSVTNDPGTDVERYYRVQLLP